MYQAFTAGKRSTGTGDPPYLSVGGGGLGDDGAGLGRGQGLLDHDAAVVVRHAGVGLVLVLVRRPLKRNVLRRGRGREAEENTGAIESLKIRAMATVQYRKNSSSIRPLH